ncbi:MAG: energy-coupling factor transporter ATPase [Eubacteriaceae bacterium]|nr:energy-coupling factor transporter ATPase [Eubacteriaceae bacterium]MBQ1466054.1 energy-coupling factor transporter ATPase [Eubacteriaceae bacterium]MBR2780636.1 energy-coupling factor transporter ATPase [Eubacteriaceae bacterium]MCR4894546.1 energy-coupling factor transporter ATPase [Eubacteriales bacterium]
MSIEVKGLTHIYSEGTVFEHIAIEDVNFTVGPHDFIGIIGHTGSGKSTMIQHINRLLKPTRGTVVVNGIDINGKDVTMKDIVKRVGIVFQYPEYQLFEETVYKDVSFGPRNLGYDDEKTDFLVKQSIETVGLDYEKVKDMSPFDLSGGQKRRVAIAGVVAMKPQILILDEPASGLDPAGRREIFRMIKTMNTDLGICILLVSHSMDDVAEYCDKVMVFSEGKMVRFGTPGEVFADSEYLESISLEVPQSKQVLEMLKKRGIDIDTSPYTSGMVAEEILRRFKK